MREQAKKMNVKSLRSSEDAEKSAEGKLAKVALVTISLWFMAWTPYLVINCMGLFKFEGLTPLNTIWGACFAKSAACYNPIVYGIRYIYIYSLYTKSQDQLNYCNDFNFSHPKYRLALKEKCPCCVFGKVDDGKSSDAQSTATASEAESKA